MLRFSPQPPSRTLGWPYKSEANFRGNDIRSVLVHLHQSGRCDRPGIAVRWREPISVQCFPADEYKQTDFLHIPEQVTVSQLQSRFYEKGTVFTKRKKNLKAIRNLARRFRTTCEIKYFSLTETGLPTKAVASSWEESKTNTYTKRTIFLIRSRMFPLTKVRRCGNLK